MRLSLPARLSQEPSDLSGLEPCCPPWNLPWESFGPCSRIQPSCLVITRTIWSGQTPAWWLQLSCLWPLLHGPASPPDYHENHLIWVDLNLMVPLGVHANSSLSSFICRMVSAYCTVYCALFTFCLFNDRRFSNIFSLISLLSSEYIIAVFLILEMFSRFFDLVTWKPLLTTT